MKIDFSKIMCTIGIVVLLVILLYATYIKTTYTPNNTIQNPNINVNQNNNNIQNSEQNNNETESKEIETLNCYSVYYDEENTKANIKEEIIITFENNKSTKQEHKFNYAFDQITDYNNLKSKFDGEQQQDNIQTNYDQTTNGIERIISSDYTDELDSNNIMDFRNYNFEKAKTYLTGKQFICN